MKMKIIFIALLGLAATIYSQSLLTITSGASLTVTTGADICADSIIGAIQGGGTICGGPNYIESEDGNLLPDKFALEQNYPNPFNPNTTIKYTIPNVTLSSSSRAESREEGFVTLKVYDVLGNEVAILVNETKPAGIYEVEFNASKLSSGIYFYKLQAGSFTQTKKMTVLK